MAGKIMGSIEQPPEKLVVRKSKRATFSFKITVRLNYIWHVLIFTELVFVIFGWDNNHQGKQPSQQETQEF